jgi:hypothetical protein
MRTFFTRINLHSNILEFDGKRICSNMGTSGNKPILCKKNKDTILREAAV